MYFSAYIIELHGGLVCEAPLHDLACNNLNMLVPDRVGRVWVSLDHSKVMLDRVSATCRPRRRNEYR